MREQVFAPFDEWVLAFAEFVRAKGKVSPGRHRAFGYQIPPHRWADVKLKWRELEMKWGYAPEGSSPRLQEDLGLNRDA